MFRHNSRRLKNRCPVPGCKNHSTPGRWSFELPDVCAEHAAMRARDARAAWVDPATLTREVWTGAAMLIGPAGEANGVEVPCGACGHPRWAHAKPGYFDGPCLVPECIACDGQDGHAPGYVPSAARV